MVSDLQHHVDKELLDSCGTIIARFYFYETCLMFFKLIFLFFIYLFHCHCSMEIGNGNMIFFIQGSFLSVFFFFPEGFRCNHVTRFSNINCH